MAARICAQANAEQILATGTIHQLCDDPVLLLAYRELGGASAKGFFSTINYFEIDWA